MQGAQFSGGFTQGAQTISLLGLPPGFTLFLVDGKPMSDYPLLYNGSGNFVDISSIPMAMVDHIDIVPGNQSAIYGSSAIAGVVNIVLKKHVHGFSVDLRGGGFSQGGGGSQRLQLTGGHDWDKASLTYSLELDHQEPMYRYQNSWFDSLNDRPGLKPGETRHGLDYLLVDLLAGSDGSFPNANQFFVAAGSKGCAGVANGFGGTEVKFKDPADRGYACGSPNSPAYSTMMNGYKAANGYVNFTWEFSPNAQFYANMLYTLRKTNYYVGSSYTWWGSGPDIGVFYAANVHNPSSPLPGTFLQTQYTVDSTSAGIGSLPNEKDLNRVYVGNIGVRGNFGNSDWTYDAYYHRSDNVLTTRALHFVAEKVDHYFLGDMVSPTNPFIADYPTYNLNLDRFYSLMTPATFRSLSDDIRTRSHTYTQKVNLTVTNTDLFELPGGSAGIAALVEYGNQGWDNPTDPRLINGYFWGLTGTQGGGDRDRYAAALEMTFPFTSWLTVDTSARYDRYKTDFRSDSKLTYKLGLEVRPTQTLLLRANYATAFRAPGMARLFQGPSGFYTNVVDWYRCRQALGDKFDVDTCRWNNEQVSGDQRGNKDLENITAKSWTGGIVWSPTPDFTIHADYYRIKISNEVSTRSINGILVTEANCRLGHSIGGQAYDINSPTCQDALSLVERNLNPAGPLVPGIDNITTYPINISNEMVKGITAGTRYHWSWGAIGDFTLGANYNVVLGHDYQQYPEDPTFDLLALANLGEFKSIGSAQLTWQKDRWGITLYGRRAGSMANFKNDGRLPPWITYNASVNYQINDSVNLSLISNNVTNKRPPIDPEYTSYPFYNGQAYNGYGRSIFAELTWKVF